MMADLDLRPALGPALGRARAIAATAAVRLAGTIRPAGAALLAAGTALSGAAGPALSGAAGTLSGDRRRLAVTAGAAAGGLLLAGFLGVMVWRENTATAPVASGAAPPPVSARTAVADRDLRLSATERGRLADGRLEIRLLAIAPEGAGVTLSVDGGPPTTLARGASVAVTSGTRRCTVSYVGLVAGEAAIQGDCVPATLPADTEPSAPVERVVRAGDRVDFAGGALTVAVSIVSPAGETMRAGLAGGPLETLEQGVPAIVYVGGDACSVTFLGGRNGIGRLAAACTGATGARLAAEAAVAAELAPHRATTVGVDRTASFLDETLDVYVGSPTARRDAVRLSIDGGVLEPVPLGGAAVVDVAGTLCAVAVTAIHDDGADLSAACFGRLAGPATVTGRGEAGDQVHAVVAPGRPVALIGERVRVALSMVSPDGEAVRWSINDGGLVTTEIGGSHAVRVGDGECSVTALRREDDGVRVKAACDAAAMAARIARPAAVEMVEMAPGAAAAAIEGRLRLKLSMIAPDGEAVRLAVNGGDLVTLERGSPLSLDFGGGLCTLDYAGRTPSGSAARIRASCDATALAADVLVPAASARAAVAVGGEARLLDGRLAVTLSMISPDGEAIRFAANGGDLRTAERGKPLRFASGGGHCEVEYRGREGARAAIVGACDAAALAGPAFVPVRTERVDLAVAEPAATQGGRLPLVVNMVAPDRRALRIAVADQPLRTLERGRPLVVAIGRGACQVALVSATARTARVETACDAGAFERAPVPETVDSRIELSYGAPVTLFDGRVTLALSMIAPRRDAARIDLGGRLATLEAGGPTPFTVEERACALVLAGIGDDDRVAVRLGCGAGLAGIAAATPLPPERRTLTAGETARFFAGTLPVTLTMISPSRTGIRVSIDGAKVSSLDRGVPRTVDIGGRACRLDYHGTDRSGPVEVAIVEGSCP